MLFRESNHLDELIMDLAKWDILHAIVELSYSRFTQEGPVFFAELLKVYESGHFPFGWEGQWTDGRLIVY